SQRERRSTTGDPRIGDSRVDHGVTRVRVGTRVLIGEHHVSIPVVDASYGVRHGGGRTSRREPPVAWVEVTDVVAGAGVARNRWARVLVVEHGRPIAQGRATGGGRFPP